MFNSREVGCSVAKALMEELDPLAFPVLRDQDTGEPFLPISTRLVDSAAVYLVVCGTLEFRRVIPLDSAAMRHRSKSPGTLQPTRRMRWERLVDLEAGSTILQCIARPAPSGRRYNILGHEPDEVRNLAVLVGLQSYLNSLEHFFTKAPSWTWWTSSGRTGLQQYITIASVNFASNWRTRWAVWRKCRVYWAT